MVAVNGWRQYSFTCALVLVLVVGGCSTVEQRRPASLPRSQPTPIPSGTPGAIQTGLASWYGPGFHGKLTANGEVYNQNELTAAHLTLPLGTHVMVTNLQTKQAIEVRINDRGPYVGGRLIDLSYAAARSIGVYGPGIAPVRVEVLSSVAPVLTISYAVQLGSYADAGMASSLKARMTGRYRDVYISPMDTGLKRYYLVRLGPFSRREDAVARAEEVARMGMQVIVVEEDDRWAES